MNTAETYRPLSLLRELGDTFGCKLSFNVTLQASNLPLLLDMLIPVG
jgi:hypothetical protein